jgi:hypothetical protein
VKGLFYEFPAFIRTSNRITDRPARHGCRVQMIEDQDRVVCRFVATPVSGAEGRAA